MPFAAVAVLALVLAACGDTRRIDAIFFRWDRNDTPGCVAAASRDGEILFERAWGMADLERGVPLEPESVMLAGSIAKQFTAAAVALMALRGEVDLDADVRPWFPELRFEQTITARHLIHHTSGIRDYLELMWLAGQDKGVHLNNDIALEILSHQRTLNFEPGERHLYSNSGYLLLAVLVERADGSSLREFADQRLFEPLGMEHTLFADDLHEVVPRRAAGYRRRPDGGYSRDPERSATVGAGGVLSTAGDLLRWTANFRSPRVGGEELIELLLTRGVLSDGEATDYAFGLEHGEYRGAPTLSHSGSQAGFRARLTMFPEQDFAVAVLCNSADARPGVYANQVAEVLLEDELEARTVTARTRRGDDRASPPGLPSPESLDSYVGRYDAGDDVLTVSRYSAGLAIEAPGGRWSPMERLSEARYRVLAVDLVLQFEQDRDGRVTGVTLDPEGEARTAVRLEPFAPTAEELAEYEGEYRCTELDATYRIAVVDSILRLFVAGSDRGALDPLTVDVMLSGFGRLAFERDAGSAITGFQLDSGRGKRLAFAKSSVPVEGLKAGKGLRSEPLR